MTLNPIFESCARRRMRLFRTPLIIGIYCAVLSVCALSLLTAFMGQGVTVGRMRDGVECYIWMTALQFFLVLLVAPALSAGSIAGERERRTFDLLVMTGVGARRIIAGKLLENFAFLVLLILCGAPVMALALLTGGVTPGQIAVTLLYLMAIAFSALCVGMAATVIMRRSLSAVITAYLAVFAIGALSWGLSRHGPLAAAYTMQSLGALAQKSTSEILMGMPVPIFFNPAVGLVMLLASQTGILHRTMETTMRLYHIYSAAKAAGFAAVSAACLMAMLAFAAALLALATLLLRAQTDGFGRKRHEKR